MSTPNDVPSPADELGSNAYFVHLEFSNVRCFEGLHELDLRDKRGNPARWTLILGENGVGKTTLLELLEGLGPSPVHGPGDESSVAAMLSPNRLDDGVVSRQDDGLHGTWTAPVS